MNPFNWTDEYLAKQVQLIGPAVCFDIETICNAFTLNAESIDKEDNYTFEISERRNDSGLLIGWFNMLHQHQIPMIGYNSLGFDYPIIHEIFMRAGNMTVAEIYDKAQQIIKSNDRFGNMVWQDQRFAPQIDLYKLHHFDNRAKRQSLKGLEFNMRSASVLEMPVPHDVPITPENTDKFLIPYNEWDVKETKKFALISAEAIAFRRDMANQIKGDVLNFNDTKLGKEMLMQRIGDEICYTWTPRKTPRQTVRTQVKMSDVVFPYISFQHPELNRVLNWIKAQTLTSSDLDGLDDGSASKSVSTKGVFTDVHAIVDGFRFDFGTGGIHGSVKSRKYEADDEWMIRDIDVASLYPSVAIVNQLYPEHLGNRFVQEYSNLKTERFKYKKGTSQNAALKLALNGSYGDSGNEYSALLDKQFLLKITINGQLMLCMLAEQLMRVPTVEPIQINTDGISYRVHRSMLPVCQRIEKQWEQFTLLDLEDAEYSRMFVRDVNSYIAEDTKGKLKLKGAYWYHDGSAYEGGWTEAISKAGPSAWHKDLGAQAVQRAAVAAMVHGWKPEHFLRAWTDPFDFMLRAKAPQGAKLFIGNREVQKITRYFISRTGEQLHKVAMPKGPIGQYKRKAKVSEHDYNQWHAEFGNVWNEEIHTKNKSVYEMVDTSIQTGYSVKECNLASDFSFNDVNYDWYVNEAKKLIIA